jgi:hypothetical protein
MPSAAGREDGKSRWSLGITSAGAFTRTRPCRRSMRATTRSATRTPAELCASSICSVTAGTRSTPARRLSTHPFDGAGGVCVGTGARLLARGGAAHTVRIAVAGAVGLHEPRPDTRTCRDTPPAAKSGRVSPRAKAACGAGVIRSRRPSRQLNDLLWPAPQRSDVSSFAGFVIAAGERAEHRLLGGQPVGGLFPDDRRRAVHDL